MAENKQDSFTVTDRRLFTSDGELRKEISEEEITNAKPAEPAAVPRNRRLRNPRRQRLPRRKARARWMIKRCRRLPPRPNSRNRLMLIVSHQKNWTRESN